MDNTLLQSLVTIAQRRGIYSKDVMQSGVKSRKVLLGC